MDNDKQDFGTELVHLINRHCKENGSNTPDFVLGLYMQNCLAAFEIAVRQRDKWYGVDLAPGGENLKRMP